MSMENPIDEAKEKVEEALDNLEKVEIETKIDSVESTAQTAVDIALDVSNESREAIENVRAELIEHEESDEWLRAQIHVLMIQMASLQEELSILKASPPTPPVETIMENEPENSTAVEPETILLPETPKETSNETKTEVLNESEDVEPVLQTVLNPHRKVRLV